MAGLGEVCTHIAAVLFFLEAITKIQGKQTCTQTECEWLIPSYLKSIEYKPVREIDFTSVRGRKRKFDEMMEKITSPEGSEAEEDDLPKHGSQSTDADLHQLFQELSVSGTKPGVLSLVQGFSTKYIPKSSFEDSPIFLKSLHKPSYLQLEYNKLLEVCETVCESLTVTNEMAEFVEKETRAQSKSKLWFKHRAGRITASHMKAVCHTDPTNPAQSLIKSICYPLELSFNSKETDWGQKQEKVARDLYFKKQTLSHEGLSIVDSGLVINSQWPFIAATPDGVINCTCHGQGVLEIKCPYSHRYESVEEAASNDKKFCLKEDQGIIKLDSTHAYYHQIQTQLFVCNVDYCDFCVCTFPTQSEGSALYIERVRRDATFWEDCVTKSKLFFTTCLLPEILGNWYTRVPPETSMMELLYNLVEGTILFQHRLWPVEAMMLFLLEA